MAVNIVESFYNTYFFTKNDLNLEGSRAFFNHFFRAVPAHSALFERWNTLFSTKVSKNTCRLGGCSVLNALN